VTTATHRTFRFVDWTLRPDQDGDTPPMTYAFRCLALTEEDTECAAKSPASEDPTDPQTWAFDHMREHPEHTSYAEVIGRHVAGVWPEPAGYWAEVHAEGPMYGTGDTMQHILGTAQSISPVLVLRWLRGEALRIADRLAPDPQRSAWVQPSMRAATVPVPDLWATDPDEQRAAREHIKGGHPLFVKVPDADCTYTLSVWPVRLPADEHDQMSPEPIPHQIGGLSHHLYVLAADPWT
jgi:hypothetical protein